MDWIFNNWKYQILPMEEAIEADELQTEKPPKKK